MKKKNPKIQCGGSQRLAHKFDFSVFKEKAGFLSAVFATLFVQLLLVSFIVYYIGKRAHILDTIKRWFLGIILGMFVVILVLAFVPMHPFIKLTLFTVFSVLAGLQLAYVSSTKSPELVSVSLKATTAIFFTFLLVGVLITISNVNIGWLGVLLFFALLSLIIVRVVFLYMKNTSQKKNRIVAIVGLCVFSLFIMYDTFNILQRDYYGDFVTAALDYFLDIVNVFLDMLSVMSNPR